MLPRRFSDRSLGPAILLALWLLPAAAAAADDGTNTADDFERFYRLELGGQAAGWIVESSSADGENLVTITSTRMEVSRAGTAAAMEISSRFEETRDHRPVSGRVRQMLGAQPLETRYRFDDEGVEVRDGTGAIRRLPPVAEPWMTPAESAEYLARQVRLAYDRAEVGLSFELRRLELLTGLEPVTGRYRLQDADDPVVVDGQLRAAGRWAASESYAPLVTTLVWLDADGVLLRSEAQMMGTTMVATLTASDPRAATPAEGASLPELLVQTFVDPEGELADPRSVRRATYELHADGLDLSPMLPSTGRQSVRRDGDALVVTIDLAAPLPAGELADRERFLRSSHYLDHDSDEVQTLYRAWTAAAEEIEPAARAESLRRLVAGHLDDKNLGTVLGTASEVARERAGDCTEHAVLLAALLRAEAIPSRLAVGLVYAENFGGRRDIFAYHMWTQAFLDRRWLDLDATLPPATPFDATHILFATSDFGDEGLPLLGTGIEAVFGRLEIEIVEASR